MNEPLTLAASLLAQIAALVGAVKWLGGEWVKSQSEKSKAQEDRIVALEKAVGDCQSDRAALWQKILNLVENK